MHTWNRCIARLLVEFFLSPGKIFCLVSTLFGLKKTENLYEFKYLYPNQTFFKFPQQNCSFIFSLLRPSGRAVYLYSTAHKIQLTILQFEDFLPTSLFPNLLPQPVGGFIVTT